MPNTQTSEEACAGRWHLKCLLTFLFLLRTLAAGVGDVAVISESTLHRALAGARCLWACNGAVCQSVFMRVSSAHLVRTCARQVSFSSDSEKENSKLNATKGVHSPTAQRCSCSSVVFVNRWLFISVLLRCHGEASSKYILRYAGPVG